MTNDTKDHPHLRKIREKINKVVSQEIGDVAFKEELSQCTISERTYEEVVTKKNFYFGIDTEKGKKNLKLFNVKA